MITWLYYIWGIINIMFLLNSIKRININRIYTNGNADKIKLMDYKLYNFYISIFFITWIIFGLFTTFWLFYLLYITILIITKIINIKVFIKNYNWILNPSKINILIAKCILFMNCLLMTIPIFIFLTTKR